jgi:cell division septum initiation protein DivIVA
MLGRAEVVQVGTDPETDDDVGSLIPAPAPAGDLDGLLDVRPVFRPRLGGYDRLQVDNYVTWAEDELAAARRAGDHLRSRFAVCAAELAELRRQPAPVPVPAAASTDLAAVSERVREILRLASDEAAEIIEAATEEADRIEADARLEAEARQQKTALLREAAVAMVEQLRERVVRERAEAAAVLDSAQREAAEMLRAAAVERDRLVAETAWLARDAEQAQQDRDTAAAVAAGRLLSVQDEVEDLRRQRDQAQESLRRLTHQIGQALHGVGAAADEPNIAREYPLRPVAS